MGEKREFVELAHEFDDKKHNIAMWFMSTKLDGHRMFWDGGITRGMDPQDVPWANTSKDGRYIERPMSTGLWSRGGKTIQAPSWFVNALPKKVPLDGEAWGGRGLFQATSSIVKQLYPNDEDWKTIRYMVFDSPSWTAFCQSGRITFRDCEVIINQAKMLAFVEEKLGKKILPHTFSYDIAISELANHTPNFDVWNILPQEKLPGNRAKALARIKERLKQCKVDGDEGLMLRNPITPWEPRRSHNLLKVKERHTAEAEVIGYFWGRRTAKGSKLLGKMGAVLVKMPNGLCFELSGFTDAERKMVVLYQSTDRLEGEKKAGERVSSGWTNPLFPIGSTITYSYRELTDAGIPKEAQFDRPYEAL